MLSSISTPLLFGRGGYNGPAQSSSDDEDRRSFANFGRGGYNAPMDCGRGGYNAPVDSGRGGYNRDGDDDEEEDGRGGYN